MAENVKVIVRCRPMNRKEKELQCEVIIQNKHANKIILIQAQKNGCSVLNFVFVIVISFAQEIKTVSHKAGR